MRSQVLTLTLLALVAGSPVLAGEHGHGKADGKGHGRAWCPHCGEACYPTVTKGKETKHCFETESKPICIPKVRFPWQGAGLNLSFGNGHGKGKGKSNCGTCGKDGCGGKDVCPTTCGRTKYVNVLIKHEYECTVCKYSWDPSSFKGDSKNGQKYQGGLGSAAGESNVPSPPSVDARSLQSPDDLQPVTRALPRVDVETAQPRGGEVRFISNFFK